LLFSTTLRRVPLARFAATGVRAAALLLATWFAIVGWRLLDRNWQNFDTTLRWYGLSLILVVAVAAALPTRKGLKAGWSRLAVIWTRHRWEVLGLGAVVGVAVFMRLYDFGRLPPSGGVGFEEAQTGGIAYGIIHDGVRPVEFAITNYAAALGFLLGGYDTTALRLPFLVIGIASVPAMYVLLRLMVSAPAALFATALFAVCRWHAYTSRIADETFLGSGLVVIAALLLVTVLRTRNAFALVGLGLVTGGVAYEYSAYRHVAFLIVGALVFSVAFWAWREVFVARRPVREVLAVAATRWRLLPIFAIVLAVTVSPLIISGLHGDRMFIEAFQRHAAEQQHTGPFGILPVGWQTRLRWLTEVFLPFGPREYPDLAPFNLPGERMLDPVTASLALIAMAYAILTIHKPYRAFFAIWLFAGLLVGGIVPVQFLVPKLTGLLPALFVLISFAIDDFLRLTPRILVRGVPYMALAPLVLWAFVVNLQVFQRQADSPQVQGEYYNSSLDLCLFAKSLGPDTYVYLWSDTGPSEGLFGSSDLDWVCRELHGRALNTVSEVWPLDPVSQSSVAFVYLDVPQAELGPDPLSPLLQGYSNIGASPKPPAQFPAYSVEAFVLSQGEVLEQQGLYGAYSADGGPAYPTLARRLDPAALFTDGGPVDWPAGSTGVQWEGLVLLRREGRAALVPQAGSSLEVLIDGQVSFQSDGTLEETNPAQLRAGWHTIQMTLPRTGSDRLPALGWVFEDGESLPLTASDLFALSPVHGWTHERLVRAGDLTLNWQQVSPYPAYGWQAVWPPDWLFGDQNAPRPRTLSLVSEEWRSLWRAPVTGVYNMKLSARSGSARLSLDGKAVAVLSAGPELLENTEVQVPVEAGQHRIEIHFEQEGSYATGVNLEIAGGAGGEEFFTPF
jgi:hypothetical protein